MNETKYIYLRMPTEAWDTLGETLLMDMESPAFDKDLRDEIRAAYDAVEVVDPKTINPSL